MPGKNHNHSRWAIFLVMVLWICAPMIAHSQEPKHETLPDGVEHWYYAKQGKNQFSKLLENIINAVVNNPPFGKSVAFLVGVSEYKHLSPQLPFVKNDLELLRDFLLKKGGFDEVFVAADHAANAGLVLDYMSNNRMKLQKEDRLLFYYSGHGADMGGTTGYIQFSKAKPGELDINNYLGINECVQWSKRLKDVKHILFIYDCCVSGLAFTHKSGAADSKSEILSTLSGNGSRTVITAGTADERTFGVDNHSVFTKAFLDALNTSQNINGFMTMNEIFARIERRVKDFAGQYEKKITPRRWELEEDKYRGTFLFVDTSAKNIRLSEDVVKGLGIEKDGEVIRAEVAPPQGKKPKYQLRKEPMTVSDDEVLKIFKVKQKEIKITSDVAITVWRPLEYIQNDFKDNRDEIITDNATGLMWQKSGSDESLPYEEAKAYIEELNRKKFAGYNDWRLPTVDELKSLLTPKEMNGDLYIDPLFDKTQLYCWTSDRHTSGGAWDVAFISGSVGYDYLDDIYIRAVRSLTP